MGKRRNASSIFRRSAPFSKFFLPQKGPERVDTRFWMCIILSSLGEDARIRVRGLFFDNLVETSFLSVLLNSIAD